MLSQDIIVTEFFSSVGFPYIGELETCIAIVKFP